MISFFLAMQLYPEVQRKAQAEIDAVIGHDRLPTFQDRDRLPYVNNLCLELLRWMPVGPLGTSVYYFLWTHIPTTPKVFLTS